MSVSLSDLSSNRAKKENTHPCHGECGAQVSIRRKFCIECAVDRMETRRHGRNRVGERRGKREADKS